MIALAPANTACIVRHAGSALAVLLAVTTAKHAPAAPELPTMVEAGVAKWARLVTQLGLKAD